MGAGIPRALRTFVYGSRSRAHHARVGSAWIERARRFAPLCCALWIAALSGCARLPQGQSSVDVISIRGNRSVSEAELKNLLATRATPKFLGLIRGVFFDYRFYDHYVLQTDIQRIERIYRSFGYYHAHTTSVKVVFRDEQRKHARIYVDVEEGRVTKIKTIRITGLAHLTKTEKAQVRKAVLQRLKEGQAFEEERFDKAEDGLLYELRSLGYAHAEVEAEAQVDLSNYSARVLFRARPHQKAVYGPLKVEGLPPELPEKMLRRTLLLEEGDRYSQRELDDARNAALALGVFSSVRILPKLDPARKATVVPLVVRVSPSPRKTVEVGAGAQLDVIRAAAHVRAGWRSQNFLGGLRDFRVDVQPGVVFFPTRLQSLIAPTDVLPTVEATTRLRQPQFIEARTNGVWGGSFAMYPQLLGPQYNEALPVLGYREFQGNFSLSRAFGGHVFAAPKYTLKWATPFAYRGELDEDLRPLLISSVELYGRYDTRDDLQFPRRGLSLSGAVDYAGLGGDVRDVRLTPEARAYVPLSRRWTLAVRVATGLLFPFNWGDTLGTTDGRPPLGVERAEWVRDTQISQFRSLFAGGPNSNRGYAARGIGPHGVIPFYLPGVQAPDATLICADGGMSDPAQCLLPLGGRTRWEASLELRFPIYRALYGAVFCDAADVAPQVLRYRFDRPHLSCGAGVRYSTPIGPVRFDLGYRIPGLQTLGSSSGEGVPPELLGAPLAVSISIGEAF